MNGALYKCDHDHEESSKKRIDEGALDYLHYGGCIGAVDNLAEIKHKSGCHLRKMLGEPKHEGLGAQLSSGSVLGAIVIEKKGLCQFP